MQRQLIIGSCTIVIGLLLLAGSISLIPPHFDEAEVSHWITPTSSDTEQGLRNEKVVTNPATLECGEYGVVNFSTLSPKAQQLFRATIREERKEDGIYTVYGRQNAAPDLPYCDGGDVVGGVTVQYNENYYDFALYIEEQLTDFLVVVIGSLAITGLLLVGAGARLFRKQ